MPCDIFWNAFSADAEKTKCNMGAVCAPHDGENLCQWLATSRVLFFAWISYDFMRFLDLEGASTPVLEGNRVV